jgi:hypothetical protein
MKLSLPLGSACILFAAALAVAAGADDGHADVSVISHGPNVIATWDQVAAKTIVQQAEVGSPAEQRPVFDLDMATLHVAIYDALAAITRSYRPLYARVPEAPGQAGLPQDFAVHGAAFTVLSGLYPHRSAFYKGTYDSALAGAGPAALQSAQLGADVARQVLAKRANDGRWAPVAAAIPGASPGQFRWINPDNQWRPNVRPFVVDSPSEFRAALPPALDSTEYAADLNETRTLGSATSTLRTPEQTMNARFFTEEPPVFMTRNLHQFATSQPTLAEDARLMALLWVSLADALTTCFESKYYYNRWRPTSGIRLGDPDVNPAVVADPTWTPALTVPNFPEYPAAHSCGVGGAVPEVLRQVYGTSRIHFSFNSTVTGTTRAFDSVDALADSVELARIHGGMHFRTSTARGRVLGTRIADRVLREHFEPVAALDEGSRSEPGQ